MKKPIILACTVLMAFAFLVAMSGPAAASGEGQSAHRAANTGATLAQHAYDHHQIVSISDTASYTPGLQQAHIAVIGEIVADDTGEDDVLPRINAGVVALFAGIMIITLALGFIFTRATVRYHTRR